MRDNVRESSARSLLLTVLGEFMLPHPAPVWTAALVDVLGLLGVEEKSARQALARTAAQDWLVPERVGRRVRWSLTPHGRRFLADGAHRIYSFTTSVGGWDGRWLVVYVSVPEARRRLRHRLRTRLTWAGFGSPDPGVWICADSGREAEAKAICTELGLDDAAMSFTATFAGIGREQAMVDRAWNLDGLGTRYDAFSEEFADPCPGAGDPVLLAQTRLVDRWRRFPFADPGLPAELLPPDWAGARAAVLFRRRHAAWHQPAQQRWQELADQAGRSAQRRPPVRHVP